MFDSSLIKHPFFEVLTAVLPHGLLVYDSDFRILFLNQRAEEILGVKASTVLDKKFSLETAGDGNFKYLAQALFPSLAPISVAKSEPGAPMQVAEITNNEPFRQFNVITARLEGEIFLKIIEDKTAAALVLKTRSDFITTAAHQLRTPTLAISWAFDNLAAASGLPVEVQEIIKTGRSTARSLLKIINDLLNAAQIEEGSFLTAKEKFEPLNLVDFLAGLLREAELVAREYQVNLYLDAGSPPAGIWVLVDKVKLGLAVSNLIDNAIKYNVSNGQVAVKIELLPEGRFVEVSVKDTGIGIKPEELEGLFRKFFRGEQAMKGGIAGSGLGLYITKNIIEQHGGKIWAESFLGRGSTFYFTLPLQQK